jgi:hypothetical protein
MIAATMKITNAALSVSKNDSRLWLERVASELSGHLRAGRYPLRAAITAITEGSEPPMAAGLRACLDEVTTQESVANRA